MCSLQCWYVKILQVSRLVTSTMSENNQKSKKTPSISNEGAVSYPHIVGDSSQVHMTTVKLGGSNYLTWSKSVLIFVQGKEKEKY